MRRGRFITLEGIEGAGKSTQLPLLAEFIRTRGHAVVTTREPGGTPVGEAIRELLLNSGSDGMPASTELLLMFAARSALLQRKILPALEQGTYVICDRFTDASYAYQSAGRGIPSGEVAVLENLVQGEVRPDLVLVFDLPVTDGLARANARGETNRFEAEKRDFFTRVRQCYLDRARASPDRYAVIDATLSPEKVRSRIEKIVGGLLEAR